MIQVSLSPIELDTEALTATIRNDRSGAVATFEGTVRSPNKGYDILRLEYEAYETVALDQMREIAEDCFEEFELGSVCVVHRTGSVTVGNVAFYVGATSVSRTGALTAIPRIVDRVKAEAAIWKKEITEFGGIWVEEEASKVTNGSE